MNFLVLYKNSSKPLENWVSFFFFFFMSPKPIYTNVPENFCTIYAVSSFSYDTSLLK